MSRNTPLRHVRLWVAGGPLVLLCEGLIWDQATPDPPHSGGPPIYLYVSVLVVAVAGVLLGTTLARRPATGERLRTAVAQLLATVVLFTPVIDIYAVFDPSYLTMSVARSWYVVVSVVGVVLVAAFHLLDYVLNDALAVRSEPA